MFPYLTRNPEWPSNRSYGVQITYTNVSTSCSFRGGESSSVLLEFPSLFCSLSGFIPEYTPWQCHWEGGYLLLHYIHVIRLKGDYTPLNKDTWSSSFSQKN